jgi:hypothetical protein
VPVGRRDPRCGALGCCPCSIGEAWLHEIKHDGFRVIARN